MELARNPRRLGYGFAKDVGVFLEQEYDDVLRELAGNVSLSGISADDNYQQRAWEESITWIYNGLVFCRDKRPESVDWGLCLEFAIPRRGYRIDAVLIAGDVVLPIEFKSSRSDASVTRQAEDYGHELSDFHEGSQNQNITPLLCSPNSEYFIPLQRSGPNPKVARVSTADPARLGNAILEIYDAYSNGGRINFRQWLRSTYKPTPTIIEAATALYRGH